MPFSLHDPLHLRWKLCQLCLPFSASFGCLPCWQSALLLLTPCLRWHWIRYAHRCGQAHSLCWPLSGTHILCLCRHLHSSNMRHWHGQDADVND